MFVRCSPLIVLLGLLCSIGFIGCVVGLQPPSKEAIEDGTFESVHDYRRRLGIQYDYKTKHINPEFCKTLSEDECREMDEEEGRAATKNRKLLTPHGREEIRRALQRTPLSEEGTLNVLVFLMLWSDHVESRDVIDREVYDDLFNAEGTDEDNFPTGSIKTYFETISYGQFSIQATIVDWQATDNTEAFYAEADNGRTVAILPAFEPLLESIDQQADIDFADFDSDGDFTLDMTIFLHSGYDAANGGNDCFTNAGVESRINAHARSSAPSSTFRSADGYRLGAYVVASAYRQLCDFNIARIGVIAHEMLHPFGLPDLYDIDRPFSGALGGIGNYDIMSNPAGQVAGQAIPGHPSAWTRIFVGWAEPTIITEDGTYTAPPVEQEAVIFRIDAGYAEGEYLLIENRQPVDDFDADFYVPGGITIYHIDENNLFEGSGFGNSPRGDPFTQADWPGNNNHYPVALLQRDGQYELERGLEDGHIEDVFTVGADGLEPGDGLPVSTTAQYPNTDSYANGNIQITGISIRNFQASTGNSVSFDVVGIRQVDDEEEPSTEPSLAPSTNVGDGETEEEPSTEPSLAPSTNIGDGEPSSMPSIQPSSSEQDDSEAPSAEPSTTPENNQPSPAPVDAPSPAPVEGDRPTLPFAVKRGPLDFVNQPSQRPTIMSSSTRLERRRNRRSDRQRRRRRGKGGGKGKGSSSIDDDFEDDNMDEVADEIDDDSDAQGQALRIINLATLFQRNEIEGSG